MSKLKTQFGTALTADFQENTWTFLMPDNFKVSAGEFAILPKDKYNELLVALSRIKDSVSVHPDCVDNSEFADMVITSIEALDNVS